MPGPYSESPNIPGTYRVSQNTVNQILGMGMERALQMARTNPDPEFREAVYRIYPSAAAGGASSTGSTPAAPFGRPQFANLGAGPAESSVPGATGGPTTPPVATPLPNPGGSPMGGPMGGPVGPTGMPNNAPPVPPPPPIPQPTIPTPQVPDQLRELFGLPPVAGGPGGAPPAGSPGIGAPGEYAAQHLDPSVGGPVSPISPPPGTLPGGPGSRPPITSSGSAGGVAGIALEQGGGMPPSGPNPGGGITGSALAQGGGVPPAGPLGGAGGITGAALAQGQTERPPGYSTMPGSGGQLSGGGGRASSGPLEGIGQTNPMARRLLEKRMLSNPVSDTVDFLGTGIGGFHNFGPSNQMNSDLANMILEMLGIPTSRTNR